MERSNYYLIFCFHAVGSDKAKYYFIPPPPPPKILQKTTKQKTLIFFSCFWFKKGQNLFYPPPPHSKYTTISTNNKTILFLLQSVHFLLTLSTVDLSHKKQNKVKPNCRGKTDSSIPGGCATPMRKGSHDSCPDQGHDKLDTIYFLLSFLLFCSFLPIRPFVLQGNYIILCIVTGRDDDGHITDNNIRSKQWQNAERCEDQENSVVSTTSDGESWKHNH